MQIKEVKIKEIWENFLLKCQNKTFLDSWSWGEFQKSMGSKVWRLGIYENEDLISSALVYRIEAKRGTFLFLPHGPTFAEASAGKPVLKHEVLKIVLNRLKEIAKGENASFIRIAPILELGEFFYDQYLVGPLFVTNRVFALSDKVEDWPLNIPPWNLQLTRFEYATRAD